MNDKTLLEAAGISPHCHKRTHWWAVTTPFDNTNNNHNQRHRELSDSGTQTMAARLCGDIPNGTKGLEHIAIILVYAWRSDDIGETHLRKQYTLFQ
jgi:hypothetical protein